MYTERENTQPQGRKMEDFRMNEKTARQIAEMKTQTIGVEVEMNNITRQKAAKVAATYFGTGRYENTAGRNGYSTWSAWDSQGREWKFQKDVSIAGPEEQECELVTPILTYGDIETLQELCRQLRHAGAKSDAALPSDFMIHDASYLRLKNVTLSYTFDLKKKCSWLKDLTLSVSGENLFLWKKYNGFDPDVSSEGTSSTLRRMDLGAYPKPRTIIFSLQLRY